MKFKKYLKECATELNRIEESIEDMDKRCEKCNTLLNDSGTCPKCDEGEEDYGDDLDESCKDSRVKPYGKHWFCLCDDDGSFKKVDGVLQLFKTPEEALQACEDEIVAEELSNKEKLLRAYPELNFDSPSEDVVTEEISNREKLKRAYPELDFDSTPEEETVVTEELSNKEKLLRAFPELDFSRSEVVEDLDSSDDFYDDDYEVDEVEQDRAHAALYGGERTYCDCGRRLSYDEQGSYCPDCDHRYREYDYDDDAGSISI